MTPQFKEALLETLRATPDEKFNRWEQYPLLFLMLPWLQKNHPQEELNTSPPAGCSTVNWPLYLRLSGLQRTDFFIKAPDREEQQDNGLMRHFPYARFSHGYPCPTVGAIIQFNDPTFGDLADIIEFFYVDAGGFEECQRLIA